MRNSTVKAIITIIVALNLAILNSCKPDQREESVPAVSGKPAPALPLEVEPDKARAMMDGDKWVYLDVRSVEEFTGGHPAGAWNIPLLHRVDGKQGLMPNPDFLAQMEKRFPKSTRIVCGCRSGRRSGRAADMLRSAGYASVVNMAGGFEGKRDVNGKTILAGWKERNYPVETGNGGTRSYEQVRAESP